MKTNNPHPYSRKTVRRLIAKYLREKAELEQEKAAREQLQAQIESIAKENIAAMRRVQAELFKPSGIRQKMNN